MNKRSTHNYPLWIGLSLTSLFLLVAVFGPRLAPHDPVAIITDVFRIGGRAYVPSVQPVPPLTVEQFALGTDIGGRDLFSRLLWAVRPTLILCFIITALRIALGLVLGLAAGWFGGAISRLIEIVIDVSLAVPILLFALAVISFVGDHELRTFVLALVTTGWAGTAVFAQEHGAEIQARDATRLADQAQLVVGVVDDEPGVESDRFGLAAQDPHARRVEGARPQIARRGADQVDDA